MIATKEKQSTVSANGPVCSPDAISAQHALIIWEHLEVVLSSSAFAGSKRSQDFLRLIVSHAVAGRVDSLRERMIGAEMFGRPINYDTANDAVVRVKATEVRRRLAQYYRELSSPPPVRIELPTGSYEPKFHWPSEPIPSPNEEKPAVEEKEAVGLKSDSVPEPRSRSSLEEQPPETAGPHGTPREPRRRRLVGFAAATVLLLLATSFLVYPRIRKTVGAKPEFHSIAVLPIQNLSGDPRQDYLADGMTEQLIVELGQISALRVISRTSSMTYANTKKSLPEIARELGVDAVVEGSMKREGGRIQFNVELEDARTDSQIWTQSYDRDPTSMMDLEGEVAGAIADRIRIEMNPEVQKRLARTRTIAPEAQEMYLKGMAALNGGSPEHALADFQNAVQREPTFAEAHSSLAAAYGRLGDAGALPYDDAYRRQLAEAVRAVNIDETLADAHAEIADAALNLTWNWAVAERELHRALQLNPNSVEAHRSYASFLYRVGRTSEALSEAQTELRLDPVSTRTLHDAAYICYFSRRYDDAVELIQRAGKFDTDPNGAALLLAMVDNEKGKYQEAIEQLKQLGDKPHALGVRGIAYARLGQGPQARKVISQLTRQVKTNGIGRFEIAYIYGALGERDAAFAWLGKALQAHDKGMTYLKAGAGIDSIRSDPRYPDLIRSVGFPP